MKKTTVNNTGFTLIELLIYMMLLSLFISAAVLFAWNLILGAAKNNAYLEVTQNLRLAGKRIGYEIRNASSINSLTTTSINLAMADSTRNPTVIDLSSNRIRIGWGTTGSCPANNPCFLTSNSINVSNLTFTNLSVSTKTINIRYSITIDFTGTRQEYQRSETFISSVEVRSN